MASCRQALPVLSRPHRRLPEVPSRSLEGSCFISTISPPVTTLRLLRGYFQILSLFYSRPQQDLPAFARSKKLTSTPPVNSTRRDLLQLTKRELVMTGMRMPQQKQDSRLWLAFANSQGLANTAFFFFFGCTLTNSATPGPGICPRWGDSEAATLGDHLQGSSS